MIYYQYHIHDTDFPTIYKLVQDKSRNLQVKCKFTVRQSPLVKFARKSIVVFEAMFKRLKTVSDIHSSIKYSFWEIKIKNCYFKNFYEHVNSFMYETFILLKFGMPKKTVKHVFY